MCVGQCRSSANASENRVFNRLFKRSKLKLFSGVLTLRKVSLVDKIAHLINQGQLGLVLKLLLLHLLPLLAHAGQLVLSSQVENPLLLVGEVLSRL